VCSHLTNKRNFFLIFHLNDEMHTHFYGFFAAFVCKTMGFFLLENIPVFSYTVASGFSLFGDTTFTLGVSGGWE
jgi:hypothetical protein